MNNNRKARNRKGNNLCLCYHCYKTHLGTSRIEIVNSLKKTYRHILLDLPNTRIRVTVSLRSMMEEIFKTDILL